MSEWSYCFDGQNHHKTTEPQLIELFATGKLNGTTMVWTEGMDDWVKASDSRLAEHVVTTAVCAASGKVMPQSEMLQYGEHWLDPAEKDDFVAGLMEDGKVHKKFATSSDPNQIRIESPSGKGKWAKWLIMGYTGYSIAYSVFVLIGTIVAPQSPTFLIGNMLLSLLSLVIFIPAVIFYCMWLYRCSLNCHCIKGAPLNTSPGMAVGWYFIPFANIWMPFPDMKEIWNVTFKGGDSSIVGWWWGIWVFGSILGGVVGLIISFSKEAGTMEETLANSLLIASTTFGIVILITACILIVKIISRISAAHDELV